METQSYIMHKWCMCKGTHTQIYIQITLLNRVSEIQLIPKLDREVERISQPSQTNFLNMECKH